MNHKKSSTPSLLPWIPAGVPDKDKSKNRFVHKKNSKIEGLELGESNANALFKDKDKDKYKKNSTWALMSEKKPPFLSVSQKSEEDRVSLQNKIKDIFEEEEEEQEEEEENEKDHLERQGRNSDRSQSRHRSASPKRSRSREQNSNSSSRYERKSKKRSKSEDRQRRHRRRHRSKERRDKSRHKSRSPSVTRNENSPVVRRYRKDEGFFEPSGYRDRPESKAKFHGRPRSAEHSSGFGSLMEDGDDPTRHSIDFIDSINAAGNQIQPRHLAQVHQQPAQVLLNHGNPGINNVPNPPNPALVDIPTEAPWPNRVQGYTNDPYGLRQRAQFPGNQGYSNGAYQEEVYPPHLMNPGFNQPQFDPNPQMEPSGQFQYPRGHPRHQRHSLQSQFAPIPYSDGLSSGNSGYGFQSIPLQQRRNSAPEAWLVFPKGGGAGRSSRVSKSMRNYASQPLKFTESVGSRLKQSFTRLNRETPVEKFNLMEEKPKEVRRQDKRRNAMIAAVATIIGCLLLGLGLIGIAAATTTTGGSNTGSVKGASIIGGSGSTPLNTSVCNNYNILDQAWRKIVPRYIGSYKCDLERPKLQEGWYRFQEPAGTFLPTSAPGSLVENRICGPQMAAWVDGEHPKKHEGTVSRRFCFQWETGPCQFHVNSNIRTCEDAQTGTTFYVYLLKIPSDIPCNFGYCARS
ncbi:hypothetical protein TCAL_08759 [Tigriopus californicus]|uniref:UMOD/GP2/OIT3-like D8C domain-containing protein n=1 Tax=Tigriopus californicus TaxID=6832 RepID=A0A553PMC0_TIGCA|nr:uncharacterized protein LOC131891058 [Tigriopus californicus]TRY78825.1 hypothetical protein TCAL_08759 [Tigriopus californicus]|eukprot:TCALIF_08759-PA protein Name:"Similar to UMOD Uromodulin (Bos taurus)" AED:0.02 eAED:0.02 QI:102/1/0.75/1/1/1/4/0/682